MKVKFIKNNYKDEFDLIINNVYDVFSIEDELLRVIDEEGDISYMGKECYPPGYLYPPDIFEIVEDEHEQLKELFTKLRLI